jgi:hypothetical protein
MNKLLHNGAYSIVWLIGYPLVVIPFMLLTIDGIRNGQYGSLVQSTADLTLTKSPLLLYLLFGWICPAVLLWCGSDDYNEWRSRVNKWFLAPTFGFFVASMLWYALDDETAVNFVLATTMMLISIGLGGFIGMLRCIARSFNY